LTVKLVVSLHFFMSSPWVLTGLSFPPEMGLLLLFSVCNLRFRKGTWDRLVSYLCRWTSSVFSSPVPRCMERRLWSSGNQV
jgi:hypothetical protein